MKDNIFHTVNKESEYHKKVNAIAKKISEHFLFKRTKNFVYGLWLKSMYVFIITLSFIVVPKVTEIMESNGMEMWIIKTIMVMIFFASFGWAMQFMWKDFKRTWDE